MKFCDLLSPKIFLIIFQIIDLWSNEILCNIVMILYDGSMQDYYIHNSIANCNGFTVVLHEAIAVHCEIMFHGQQTIDCYFMPLTIMAGWGWGLNACAIEQNIPSRLIEYWIAVIARIVSCG